MGISSPVSISKSIVERGAAIKNGILQNQTVHVRDAAAGGHVHLVLIQDMAQK